MSQLAPGLDYRDWETERQALEDSLHGSPAETLPEVDDGFRALFDDLVETRKGAP